MLRRYVFKTSRLHSTGSQDNLAGSRIKYLYQLYVHIILMANVRLAFCTSMQNFTFNISIRRWITSTVRIVTLAAQSRYSTVIFISIKPHPTIGNVFPSTHSSDSRCSYVSCGFFSAVSGSGRGSNNWPGPLLELDLSEERCSALSESPLMIWFTIVWKSTGTSAWTHCSFSISTHSWRVFSE